jgi:carbon-monoxide dehydrogenase medium subunit
MIAPFNLRRPASVDEAAVELAGGGVPYCGGTELVAAMQLGLLAPETLVDLKGVDGLSGVRDEDGMLVIGATTAHRTVARSPLVAERAPILVTACSSLGNQRVRATGTVGGNLCFAEPRSDVATVLVALGAEVVLHSVRGRRTLPLEEFLLGAFETDRADDELLVEIRVPNPPAVQVYLRHQPAEYPTVCVAVTAAPGLRGPVGVVVGAVGEGPQAFRADALEAVDAAAIADRLEINEDLNGAQDYKRHLAAVFIRRAVAAIGVSDV